MSNVQPFDFNGMSVRVVEVGGVVWFVARDVAKALGYAKPQNAISAHCKNIESRTIPTKRGDQCVNVIPRQDVIRLMARARTVGDDGLGKLVAMIDESANIMRALNDIELPNDLPDMYVYAIRESETGRIKLGISRDPESRLRQLQTGNSQELTLVAYRKAENRYQDESVLHKLNSAAHVRGEWFNESASLDGHHQSLTLVEKTA